MPLLEEIIDTAIDTQQSLSVLLRKCLLLAYQLDNARLKSWANQELNGYGSEPDLPDYRIVHVSALADFSGYFGAKMHNWPIPPSLLEERHRDFAKKLYLRQAISSYESALNSGNGILSYAWPADLCLYYQDKFIEDFALIGAWQSISKSGIAGLIDTVRNRTLNMALELKAGLGATPETSNDAQPGQQDRVTQAITHNIFHGPAYFASGSSRVKVSTCDDRVVIQKGSRDELDQVLLRSGLSKLDIDELTNALQEDGPNTGGKLKTWIGKTAPKVFAGGVKIGSKVAQSLLTEWLNQYLGLG